MPKISVIIPVYNRLKEIDRAVKSVLNQSFQEFELIIVDDCSTDGTRAYAESIEDHRVRCVALDENHGAPYARNVGIRLANSHLIAFQDSDDYWFPDKLAKQFAALDGSPDAGFCYCQLARFYSDFVDLTPGISQPVDTERLYEDLLKRSAISTQTLLVRKEVLSFVGCFDERLSRFQDWDLVLRMAQISKSVFVREPLVVAYETPGSLTSASYKGVAARNIIIEKHREALKREPKILARHYYISASLARKHGHYSESMSLVLRSLAAWPWGLKAWFLLIVDGVQWVVFRSISNRN